MPCDTVPAEEALRRLREGNERFVNDRRTADTRLGREVRAEQAKGQCPFVIILSCADSRVPVEQVFDYGIGDLFVIRVAGNIVVPSLLGSVEFAAANFNTRLAVVMGHSKCGAIKTTMELVDANATAPTSNLQDIVDCCRGPVESAMRGAGNKSKDEVLQEAIRANVRHSCQLLRERSPLLEKLCQEQGMRIVGAEYSLETGKVEFFEGV
jgi:carbonic anhydrase